MSTQSPWCTVCHKRFGTWPGVYSHAKARHPKHNLSALKALAFRPDDGGIADMFDV